MYVSVSGRKYWIEDEGEGSVLVLLHGFTGSTNTFDEVVDQFSGSYRIIRIDLPGHARTGPVGVLSMEQFCRDLYQLFIHLGTGPVNLLGYSLGGRTALSFAVLYPAMVEKVVLESASPGLESSEDQLSRQAKDAGLAEKLENEGLEAFVDFWETIPLFDSHQTLPVQKKAALREERMSHKATGLAESLLGMGTGKQPSWWERLAELRCPVLLITGKQDTKFHQINSRMEEILPNSCWEVVDQAGHTVHLEQTRIFAKIVEDFMIQ
ncbi:2-succinyl-6-hydroxy-2,4-cyclohexadiene-1-carboxylate synthase [Halobacillus yeomjeoni]|uniref:2-succinyl-6-hydroxy-2, 4-cyclohexadiene-1-carboxylate synthase n=1 Tax=Halobacillus yeomjeoni TaxID=311194 RepID=UPI001CD81B22|nr:2-succinyl-6-hydroxy-2,4-cyclohexadiene-1-carboxylate synthase [Halobacillus yeomjeoni]MCA0984479.1 2-succinyl-6-hydroxy-2,4-cyclohexadiene-1-carboxylate synthase [Halobacillus yeomjeoni]